MRDGFLPHDDVTADRKILQQYAIMEMVWIELNTDEGRNDATEKMLKKSSLVCCFTLPHQVVFSHLQTQTIKLYGKRGLLFITTSMKIESKKIQCTSEKERNLCDRKYM